MRSISAFALASPESSFERCTIRRRELETHDVLIKIDFCGICHTDVHTARQDWGETTFPLVPGHEIAGTVQETGGAVTKFTVNDRVGVGCMIGSCGRCDSCIGGSEQYCAGVVWTYDSLDRDGVPTYGGYSTHIVVHEDFFVRIPDGLALDVAAPLLCAGVTAFSPLRHWAAGPEHQVAIVGFGGVGHVAVQIAHAMGAEVTVLSQTLSKRADALRLGADHYYATKEAATFPALAGRFDLVLNTVSASLSADDLLSLLRLDGTVVNVGAPAVPFGVDVFSLLTNRRNLAGSLIGSISETQEMLEFCAARNVAAQIERIEADRINQAYERLLRGDVRYRFVIDGTTF